MLGFYRATGEENTTLRDGDLVIYERLWRQYGDSDVILYDKNGWRIDELSAMNGGEIKGRVLALLRVRGIVDE